MKKTLKCFVLSAIVNIIIATSQTAQCMEKETSKHDELGSSESTNRKRLHEEFTYEEAINVIEDLQDRSLADYLTRQEAEYWKNFCNICPLAKEFVEPIVSVELHKRALRFEMAGVYLRLCLSIAGSTHSKSIPASYCCANVCDGVVLEEGSGDWSDPQFSMKVVKILNARFNRTQAQAQMNAQSQGQVSMPPNNVNQPMQQQPQQAHK